MGGGPWTRRPPAGQLTGALAALAAAGIIADQPVKPLARLLSGAMNEAALWIARGGDLQAAEQALDRLLDGPSGRLPAGLRTPA
ncbi:hypothetical protein [Streptomyces sp. NPDC059874]|uniref:hypothetical protein n=1 Tax=Streptomyces sp. NPDC059874 TaxID=3346983 RepID=UPI00365B1DA1